MQALSGAGRSPGVSAMDILDNIVPYIPKEEEKVEKETLKILGKLSGDEIAPAPVTVSCTCTRVNVLEGHTESVFVELKKKASLDDVKAAWRAFGKDMAELKLPSAPKHLISVSDDPFRPQVRLDRDAEGGMSTVVGRLRSGSGVRQRREVHARVAQHAHGRRQRRDPRRRVPDQEGLHHLIPSPALPIPSPREAGRGLGRGVGPGAGSVVPRPGVDPRGQRRLQIGRDLRVGRRHHAGADEVVEVRGEGVAASAARPARPDRGGA